MAQKNAKAVAAAAKVIEHEVEKGRDMGEWRKVLDILEVNRSKNTGTPPSGDLMFNFLYNEAKLETWLEDHQPTEKYIQKANSALLDIKKGIQLVLSHSADQNALKTDGRLLMAKLYYASGLYEEALEEVEKSGISNVADVVHSVRNTQLMAEANAIKGHALEKVGRSWRGSQNMGEEERKKEILCCYQKSADLAIAYFQGQEKLLTAAYASVGAGATQYSLNWEKRRPSSLLDQALRRGPTLLLEDGRTVDAITRLHNFLRTTETHFFTPVRIVLYRRLAEILLRSKWNGNILPAPDTTGRIKYHVGSGLFTPHNVWEDLFLVLLLSQGLVVKEGVLNQAPEFGKARKLANLNTAAIFDLVCVTMGRWGQFALLNDCFEQALKYSFEEGHLWGQYGLSFLATGVNSRKSNQTVLEAAKLNSRPTPLLLLAAQQSFSRLLVEEGMHAVQKAKAAEKAGVQRKLLHRVYLHEGIGYFLWSFEKHMHQQRDSDLELSIKALLKAVQIDPMDYLSLHWLARVYAWTRNINESFAYAMKALRAFPFHLPTLQLIVLLLSAQRNYTDALAVTEEALDEYPDHMGFLQLKAALDKKIFGSAAALMTVKQMLVIWKNLFEDGYGHSILSSDSPDFRNSGVLVNLTVSSPTDRENSVASFRAPSIACSSTNTGTLTTGFRADAALSEIASSLSVHGSLTQAAAGELAWTAQINIWIMLAELYLNMDKPLQAASSLEEASQIAAAHCDVLYFKGQIEEYVENYTDARVWYESAVAVRPTHVKSLQSLALMQHYFGSHRLAEKTLQDALKLDPYDYHTWYNLGKVLEALEEFSEAGDCMATALDIEAISPILPYSIIPICFE